MWGAFITLGTEMSREGRGYWKLETEKVIQKMSPYRSCTQKRDTASLKPACREGIDE